MATVVGNRSVIVRGFDFGTTHEQIAGHMSGVGKIERIDPVVHEKYGTVDKGVVRITYASAEEAKMAVQHMQQTCIAGNTRYIDVITLDPQEFLVAQLNIDAEKTQQFFALSPEQQYSVMAKGTLTTARDPNAVLATRMGQAREATGGNGSNSAVGDGCCVLVRGFDFGTTYEQITSHMSTAGKIESMDPVLNEKFGTIDKGVVRITYASAQEAKMALQLEQTIITGNSRYLEVMLLDPKEFIAGHNVDSDKALQFFALTPEQQLSVMAKGSLAGARNPNAVLATRMGQARLLGKGGFGKAQMNGNANGPYGKGGADMNDMMKQMQQMMMTMMQTMAAGSSGAPMQNMAASSMAQTMPGSSTAPMGGMAGSFGAPMDQMGATMGAMAGSFGAPMDQMGATMGAMAGSFGAPMGATQTQLGSPMAQTGAMAGSFGNPMEAMAGSFGAQMGAMGGTFGAPQSGSW